MPVDSETPVLVVVLPMAVESEATELLVLYSCDPFTASVEAALSVPGATLVIFWAEPEPWLAS